jgi:hypothetical protein
LEADNINIIRKLFLCDDRHNYYSLSSTMFYFYTTFSFFFFKTHTQICILCISKMNTNYYIYKSKKNCTKFYSHSEYDSNCLLWCSHTIQFSIRFFLSMRLLQKSYCMNIKDKYWELMQNGFKIDGWHLISIQQSEGNHIVRRVWEIQNRMESQTDDHSNYLCHRCTTIVWTLHHVTTPI